MPRAPRRNKYSKYYRKGTKRFWHKPAKAMLTSVGQIGLKVLKKKLGLNTENKNWDNTVPVSVIPTTLTNFLIPTTGIAQGTTNNERTGNGLRITHYKFRGAFSTAGAINPTFQRIRVIWTLQRKVTQPGLYVTAAQLLQVPTDIDSPYNSDLENVRVIYDKTFMIKPNTAATAQMQYKFKWSPSYDSGHVRWLDSDLAGLPVNQTEGLFQMFMMSDQPVNPPEVRGYGRIHYVDN